MGTCIRRECRISCNGKTGEVVLTVSDFGLDQVDNTSDINKPISIAQAVENDIHITRMTAIEAVDTTQTADIGSLKARSINTGDNSGLGGGGDLSTDRDLVIDVSNAIEVTALNPSDIVMVDTGSGVRKITRDNLLAGLGRGSELRGTVNPKSTDPTPINSMAIIGDSLNANLIGGQAPTFSGVSPAGFTYIVLLDPADRNTGVDIQVGGIIFGTTILETWTVFDQDQIIWVGEAGSGQWTHLETGDSVISVHGRQGVVTAAMGDYTASQVVSSSGNVQTDVNALKAADTALQGVTAFMPATPEKLRESVIVTPESNVHPALPSLKSPLVTKPSNASAALACSTTAPVAESYVLVPSGASGNLMIFLALLVPVAKILCVTPLT